MLIVMMHIVDIILLLNISKENCIIVKIDALEIKIGITITYNLIVKVHTLSCYNNIKVHRKMQLLKNIRKIFKFGKKR